MGWCWGERIWQGGAQLRGARDDRREGHRLPSERVALKPIGQRLRDRERLLGTVVTFAEPALAELIGSSFDFAWIDLEHGALDVGHLNGLAIGLRAADAASFVRIPTPKTDRLSAILDAGVDGIVAPRIESAAEASALIRRLRLPPDGDRGFGPRRAGQYGRVEASAPLCVIQVETERGCRCADEIAALDGVDAVVVGTADLAHDLGCLGDTENPAFRAAIEEAREGVQRGGAAFGIAGADPELIVQLGAPTGSIGVISVDIRLFRDAIDLARQSLLDAFEAAQTAAHS